MRAVGSMVRLSNDVCRSEKESNIGRKVQSKRLCGTIIAERPAGLTLTRLQIYRNGVLFTEIPITSRFHPPRHYRSMINPVTDGLLRWRFGDTRFRPMRDWCGECRTRRRCRRFTTDPAAGCRWGGKGLFQLRSAPRPQCRGKQSDAGCRIKIVRSFWNHAACAA